MASPEVARRALISAHVRKSLRAGGAQLFIDDCLTLEQQKFRKTKQYLQARFRTAGVPTSWRGTQLGKWVPRHPSRPDALVWRAVDMEDDHPPSTSRADAGRDRQPEGGAAGASTSSGPTRGRQRAASGGPGVPAESGGAGAMPQGGGAGGDRTYSQQPAS
jgi:hypothetical protein